MTGYDEWRARQPVAYDGGGALRGCLVALMIEAAVGFAVYAAWRALR